MTNEMTNQDVSKLIDQYIKVLQPLSKDKLMIALNKLAQQYSVCVNVLRDECSRRRAFSK
jgi:hypothetical protein